MEFLLVMETLIGMIMECCYETKKSKEGKSSHAYDKTDLVVCSLISSLQFIQIAGPSVTMFQPNGLQKTYKH